jgi:hypothetical protein
MTSKFQIDPFYFSHSLDTTEAKKQNRARFISELFDQKNI